MLERDTIGLANDYFIETNFSWGKSISGQAVKIWTVMGTGKN